MSDTKKKIGEALKLERERQGIPLDNLAVDLKISEAHLECIERGEVDGLPSELYFNLFAKSYSEALGIDYQRTVEAIEAEAGPEMSSAAAEKKAKKSQPQESETEEPGEPAEEEDESESKPFVKRLLYIGGAAILFFVIVLVAAKIFMPASESNTESENAIEGTAEQNGQDQSEYANYQWPDKKYTEPQPFTLTLAARGESWATVLTDGDTAIFRRLIPGRTYEATAEFRMRVSVAVPSAVDVSLNGQEVNLRDPESRRISKVFITQINLDSLLTAPLAAEEPAYTPPPAPVVKEEPTVDTSTAVTGEAGDEH